MAPKKFYMYKLIKPFGYHVDAKSIGQAWIDMVDAIVANGEKTFDEGRERLSLQNLGYTLILQLFQIN